MTSSSRALFSPVLLVTATIAAAQGTPQALVLEGDAIPGVGAVTRIDNLAVNDSGGWIVEVDTDNTDTDADGALLRDAALFLREGQALALPSGATLDSFDSINLNAAGESGFNLFLDGTGSIFDDSGVYFGTTLVVQESDISGAPSFGPGTPYIGFFDVKINANRQLLVMASVDDPNVASTVDRALVRMQVDASGALLSETVIAAEGDVPLGQTDAIAEMATGPHGSAFNDAGDALYFVDLTSPVNIDGAIYLNDTLLAQEGSPSTVPGRNWASLTSPELDLNNNGGYVFSGRVTGDTSDDFVIVKDGSTFVQEGDTLGAISPFTFTGFGTGPIWLADDGDVLWFATWSNPDGDNDSGLFLNAQLLVEEGVTTIGGSVVDDLRGIQDGYALSDNGSFVVFEAVLADGTDGVWRIDTELGDNYCIATPNSSGGAADMSAGGSDSVSANDSTLTAFPCPSNQNGLFYYGANQVQFPFGNGFRCVGGTQVFRLDIQFTGTAGLLFHALDVTTPPTPAGQILPGATWNFQAWFRDPLGGGAFFNLSDGLSVTFAP